MDVEKHFVIRDRSSYLSFMNFGRLVSYRVWKMRMNSDQESWQCLDSTKGDRYTFIPSGFH